MSLDSQSLKGLIEATKEKLAITDKEIETVNFVFWLTCFLEKHLFTKVVSNSISEWAKLGGMKNSDEFFEYIFGELSFMAKIKVFEKGFELYGPGNSGLKSFLAYFKKLNDLRNQIAHHKFSDLKWGTDKIEDEKTKSIMTNEFYKLAENFNKEAERISSASISKKRYN